MGLFNKKKARTEAAAPISEEEILPVVTAAAIAAAEDDEVLPVVIAAAIAAYEAEQFVPTLAIRGIARTAGVRPVWGFMGTTESIDVRRM